MNAAGARNPSPHAFRGRRASFRGLPVALAVAAAAMAAASPHRAYSQETVRERIAAIRFPEIRFTRLEPESHTVRGVPVYFFHDSELPLVTFYATFDGGVRNLTRDHLAAASALPNLLRTGGTAELPPDSVDERIELMGLAMSFGQGGGGATSWVNTLTDHMDEAVPLWASMLRAPRFDSAQVERWRGTELERVRRGRDDPGTLAFGRFNHIMYGDHPVGWEMDDADLEPADLAPEKLRHVHGAIICPDNMVLGVTGDVTWQRASAMLEEMLDGWPPCSGTLLEDAVPVIRDEPGVFVIHREIEQSVIVMAHVSRLRQGDNPAYFASRVANSILGASGFSSRLVTEVRTREGLAYGASSLWTTSSRNDGLVGALTRTRPEATLEATRLILATFDSMRAAPPAAEEVARTIDETVNGFVFNFRTPLQVISRGMAYRALGLPDDWLERYVRGIQGVTPRAVQEVFRREVDPARMTILLVGDTIRFDGSPSELGPVTVLEAGPPAPSPPRGSPRSPRSEGTSRPSRTPPPE
ncbi:MAG: insulinase family protein [Gemmatimonadetes bacterium]|nr:insulinase family protein [Gemmatimonadota bacterium]MYD14828.1 insulinase family protein [Gemmatimonadota bacterium]MYI65093.1 insulinase family protein [Gemmatimonadota bacterium]